MFAVTRSWMLHNKMAQTGDRFILTAGLPAGVAGKTNLLKVVELKG
jgi:pyruvate kinase